MQSGEKEKCLVIYKNGSKKWSFGVVVHKPMIMLGGSHCSQFPLETHSVRTCCPIPLYSKPDMRSNTYCIHLYYYHYSSSQT